MIELTKREDIQPRCPHCNEDLRSLLFQELAGFLGRRYVYFCGACRAVLGVSHRKGFFMG
ncbi:MAG: hypothetical protein PVH40_00200 [Gemmatimonadales bacterium]|jgi:hypothetical protein